MSMLVVRKLTVLFLFLAICIFGAALRLRNVGVALHFSGDADRDVLVAKHVVTEKKLTDAHPAAYGGNGLLTNSPHYFNFLAFIYLIGRSPEGVVTTLALVYCLLIPASFFLGRSIGGNRLGLGIAFITATNFQIAYVAHLISQPWVHLTLSSFALCFFLIGFHKSKTFLLSLGAIFYALGLHIHYSVTPILIPVFFLLVIYARNGFTQKSTTQKKKLTALIPLAIFILVILHWALTINSSVLLKDGLVRFLVSTAESTDQSRFQISELISRFNVFLGATFSSDSLAPKLLSVFSVLFLILLSYRKRKLSLHQNIPLCLLLLFSSIVFTLWSSKLFESYYSPYYFLLLVIISYVLFEISRCFSSIVFFAAILLFSTPWLFGGASFLLTPYPDEYVSDRQSQKNIVKYVLNDVEQLVIDGQKIEVEEAMIIDQTGPNYSLGWAQPGYYYEMEEQTRRKLVSVIKQFYDGGHNNIRPDYAPKVLYLVCTVEDIGLTSDEEFFSFCIERFWEEVRSNQFTKDFYRLDGEVVLDKQLTDLPPTKLSTQMYRFVVTK